MTRTSTEQPATALPWHVARMEGGRRLAIVNKHGGLISYFDGQIDRAENIVTACNAYPGLLADRAELVAALRKLSRECDGELLGSVQAPSWMTLCQIETLLHRIGEG
ncbi:MAG: hypothetical protein ACREVW_01100 [Burkholderiales bacterium]